MTRGRAPWSRGRPLDGVPLLEDVVNRQAGKAYKHSPTPAHLRAIAGLCAMAAGRRDTAIALAERSRRALLAQPGDSPCCKSPLPPMEPAPGGRR